MPAKQPKRRMIARGQQGESPEAQAKSFMESFGPCFKELQKILQPPAPLPPPISFPMRLVWDITVLGPDQKPIITINGGKAGAVEKTLSLVQELACHLQAGEGLSIGITRQMHTFEMAEGD
jgi:hypothetical protein